MSFTCPACHSQDVRRLQLIYREGASTLQATTSSVGVAYGGGYSSVGSGRGITTGTQQTLLSRGAAPPEKMKSGGLIVGLVIGSLLVLGGIGNPGGALLFGLALAGICGYRLKQAMHYNGNVFPVQFKRWENSFMCNRCGERFIPAALAPAAANA